MTRRHARGLTMLELMIALAVLAVLAAVALPSISARLERQRLSSVAETLATDLAEARFEAARRGQALHVEASAADKTWCWAVSTQSGCDCAQEQACQLHKVRSSSYRGIKLVERRPVRLDPAGTTDTLSAALFESSRGERLRVDMQALGRVRVCTAAGPDTRYPRC
jgi:type IV fimbrial biogenesis protein FimT